MNEDEAEAKVATARAKLREAVGKWMDSERELTTAEKEFEAALDARAKTKG
jgi:hypothetical protein